MNRKRDSIDIGVFSSADSVAGQGVGSAFLEQVNLLREGAADQFTMHVNEKGRYPLQHFHTIDPKFFLRMKRSAVNIAYCHFLPDTLKGSLRIPGFVFPIVSRYVISFYNKADHLVVVNPIFIDDLVRYGIPREKITYIPNFVSEKDFYPLTEEERRKARENYGIDPNAFVVLGCGQVQTRKGVQDFASVARALPDIQFVWAGGFSFGALTEGYKELRELMDHPPKNVLFTGIVDRSKMNEIYGLSDVLFVPSYNELFPMTILEAASAGKPILTRDLELYEKVLFDFYEKAADNEGFQKELQKLQDPSAYARAVRKSEEIARFYSRENVLSLWKDFYQNAYDDRFANGGSHQAP